MATKSTVIDGLLLAIGIFLVLQTIGGVLRVLDTSKDNGFRLFGATFSVIIGGIAFLLLRYVHGRRKRRQAESEAKIKERQSTSIGISVVGIQKQSRPLWICVLGYFSLIGGIISIPLGIYLIANPVMEIVPQSTYWSGIYSVIIALAGVFSIIIGYGLLKRKGWGWRLALYGIYFSLAWAIADSLLMPSREWYVTISIGLAIPILELYYLNRPHVRSHFGLLPTRTWY